VTQAARLLGVSRDLVYDLVKRGEVPSVRLGGRLLIARHVIAAIVNGERLPTA
jgi:excisionase family DNA binding protein